MLMPDLTPEAEYNIRMAEEWGRHSKSEETLALVNGMAALTYELANLRDVINTLFSGGKNERLNP